MSTPTPAALHTPEAEAARLEALRRYGVLDEPAGPELEALVRLASAVTGLPYATLNIIDSRHQCSLTSLGFAAPVDAARGDAMCDAAVRTGLALAVVDARTDARFRDNPWVTGALGTVRAYYSVPLTVPGGHVLGTLCVFDQEPSDLPPDRFALLVDCADLVVALFEHRRIARLAEQDAQEVLEQRDLLEQMHGELEQRHQLTDTVLETVDVGIVVCDDAGRVTHFNGTARAWHGMDADPGVDRGELAARYDLYEADGTTPLTVERIPVLRALGQERVRGAEIVIAVEGREPLLAVCDARQLQGADGRLLGAVVSMRDVTADRRRAAALRDSEARFRGAFEHAPAPIGVVAADGTWADVNPAFCAWVGRSRDDLLGAGYDVLVDPADRAVADAFFSGLLDGPDAQGHTDLTLRHRRGETLWARASAAAVPGPGGARQLICQLDDTGERRAVEERLTELALHDPLTGLPNRAFLLERLSHALSLSVRHAGTHALLFCDLDGFKAVNDTHGHAVGDELLVAVASRLTALVRPSDTVARLGGDEFVLLCEQIGADAVESVVQRVQEAVAEPVATSAGPVRVGISVGVAFPLGDGDEHTSAAAALAMADEKMYLVKRSRRAGAAGVPRQVGAAGPVATPISR